MRPPWFSNPAISIGSAASPRSASIDDVADQPRARLAHRLEVDEAEARDPALAELVAVAEQLVAATDGEHDGAVADGGRERLALGLQHVGGDQLLVAVLAATDVDQVVRGGVEALARA